MFALVVAPFNFRSGIELNAQENITEKYISSIRIERLNVFPKIPGKPIFLYELANRLHVVTRESVIRNMLLFKVGDRYDTEILEDSERNLRALAFLGAVDISEQVAAPDSVNVIVRTQDQWSTLVSYILNRGGGRTIFGGTVEEFNFLGYGKRLFAEVSHEVSEGTQFAFTYKDPQFLYSRWTTKATVVTGPFIDTFSAEMIRPFFSLDTKWAGGISVSTTNQLLRLFEQGEEVSRLQLESDALQLTGGRAWGGRFHKQRLQLSYRLQRRDFTALDTLTTSPIPDDELIHGTTLGLTLENLSFVEETQIDKFVRTEDVTLGNRTTVNIGRTGLPIPAGIKRFELSVSRREAHRISKRQYLFGALTFQTLFDKDTIGSMRLQYYNKRLPHQTVAVNIELDVSENLEASRQFLLGGDSGLRGYSAREFSGTKRFLFNFEDRIFTPITILTVAIGGVVFFDAGHVWQEEENIGLTDLNASIGIGLRLGYTKSPNSRVGRIDFAWPLSRDSGFGVTIGVDQQFSMNSLRTRVGL